MPGSMGKYFHDNDGYIFPKHNFSIVSRSCKQAGTKTKLANCLISLESKALIIFFSLHLILSYTMCIVWNLKQQFVIYLAFYLAA